MDCMSRVIHYCERMGLRTSETCLKIHDLDHIKSLSAPRLAWQVALKKTKVKLDLLTDINMLL